MPGSKHVNLSDRKRAQSIGLPTRYSVYEANRMALCNMKVAVLILGSLAYSRPIWILPSPTALVRTMISGALSIKATSYPCFENISAMRHPWIPAPNTATRFGFRIRCRNSCSAPTFISFGQTSPLSPFQVFLVKRFMASIALETNSSDLATK